MDGGACLACRQKMREWREKNPSWLARHREANRRTRLRLRTAILDHYGRTCACCGETEVVFLTLDHIDGGGEAHRKANHGNVYRDVVRRGYPSGFQTLCWNCNVGRRLAGGVCPHRA